MNKWDERYLAGESAGKTADPLLIRAVEERPPGRALDLACGLGHNSLYLAGLEWTVTAVDYSEVALEKLTRLAKNSVELILADLEQDEFTIETSRYDLILDAFFLHRPLLEQIREGVRNGGLFVGIFPTGGVNSSYLLEPGEILTYFNDWRIIHHSEENRVECIAEKPIGRE